MGTKRRLLPATAALLWGFLLRMTAAREGIIHAYGEGKPLPSKDYCMLYNPSWTTLPTTIENTTSFSLENLTTPLCNSSDIPSTGIRNKVVAVSWGTCEFLKKAKIAQRGGAEALLVANDSLYFPPSGNNSEFQDVKILIAFMSNKDLRDMQQTLGNNISVNFYAPSWPTFDYTLVVIFIIAVSSVALGGYWSGVSELEDMKAVTNTEDRETKKKEDSLTFTPLTVIMFVVGCCVIIILLYFFYKWLVYVMIAIFCLASSMSLYNCLSSLIRKIPCGQCRIACGSKSFEVRLLFLAAFCISLAVVWAVFRNDDRWAWILQDLLGMAFCLNLIKTLKLPNFKACVILLVLLLIYDVFFVFITPFITKNGESIMIEVAAGPFGSNEKNGGNLVEATAQQSAPHEKLPVVIRVPRLIYFSAMSVCLAPVSILGFGDIIVPGLLVAYCRRFDIHVGSSIYYISCVIAYAVGLVLTFIVLVLMKKGQPALLYLVSCTLITVVIIAWRRKEVKKIWEGTSYQVMENLDYGASEENVTTNQQSVQQ
ncbi:signal peptide peptidase-like 2A isoform X1 [Antechinus flavipes]|uniref:signal peptide peptidase-like 2A isoform X1 n=1 Tax=Antechinus flavipes TaxID=38775 RepID=UPI002236A2CD|nr:signal peptide peptidase-like 2A isoform X1 [Antechinus flavipes]XP_051836605.1 signal peptide peptidase-like 2A isoform X1 [Antechinus flavipes]XP_051836606.1 signal peptide peptidase-like 2A isoform X1 [Antechinus flavipes]